MSDKNPTPTDDEPEVPPNRLEVPVDPGTPVSFEVPEGTRNVTINIDPSLLGQSPGGGVPPENSFQSCSRSCGSVGLGCVGILFIVWLFGMLVAR